MILIWNSRRASIFNLRVFQFYDYVAFVYRLAGLKMHCLYLQRSSGQIQAERVNKQYGRTAPRYLEISALTIMYLLHYNKSTGQLFDKRSADITRGRLVRELG